ncbi:hypothetical protein B566_EDAN012294 [Ephemera danica]|nr:hypothetical protein B566_EDAN012294 [Ephemera danica]
MSFDSGQELCFDKEDFEKPNFSVDSFLDRRGTNFETLRDDLGQYLKELRSAMIELINQDYSDFVNLSSNLIGLDKSISKLKVPLGQFKEEILQVKCSLDEAIDELTVQLQAREQLRQSRSSLAHLRTLLLLMKKMECILHPLASEMEENRREDVNLERVSAQLGRSLVCLTNCRDLSTDLVKQHEHLEMELFSRLDSKFLEQLNSDPGPDREAIVLDCLRVYAGLDKFTHAEALVRSSVLAPQLAELIKEQLLKTGSTSDMLSTVFALITDSKSALNLLLSLTSKEPLIKFQFLLNSFWPEVCDRLLNNTPSLFAPGNPEEFYVKYTATMKFLDKIELKLGCMQSVEEFRGRQDYKNFMSKWNLPVYYQIRFQEIAGSVEEVLQLGKVEDKAPEGSEFKLMATHVTFWKLTLQLISRLQVWAGHIVNTIRDEGSALILLASLHCDLKLLTSKLPSVFDLVSTRNLEESRVNSEEQKTRIVDKIVELGNCKGEISKCATDIPRIYRRTNREVPTKAGAYVPRFLQAARDIGHSPKFSDVLEKQERTDLVFKLVVSITDTYLTAVKDLLTSVQKTEDSLRRLKQIRDKSSANSQLASGGSAVSDDDKIRLQVLQDCQEFRAQVEALGVNPATIPALCELCDFVQKSISIPKNFRVKVHYQQLWFRRRWVQLRVAVAALGVVGGLFLLWQLVGVHLISQDESSSLARAKLIFENTIKQDVSTEFTVQRRLNLLLGSRVADTKYYRPQGGKFYCLLTGKEIAFEHVNDDFCDCPQDGSDEPGTSACSYVGRFYCTYHQRASKPEVWVPSLKVNDGICDCCDGSDEWKNVTLPQRFRLSENDQRRFGVYQVPCPFTCF